MRKYETVAILDPDLTEDDQTVLLDRTKDVISKEGGKLILLDDWGTQNLAYEIKKKLRGHYIRLEYLGTGTLVNELERLFRIDERFLKYLTIVLLQEDQVNKELATQAELQATENTELSDEGKEDRLPETDEHQPEEQTSDTDDAEETSTDNSETISEANYDATEKI